MAIPFAGNRHFYEKIVEVPTTKVVVAIPFAGNRHFYEVVVIPEAAEIDVAIPFAGNRHFYPYSRRMPCQSGFPRSKFTVIVLFCIFWLK